MHSISARAHRLVIAAAVGLVVVSLLAISAAASQPKPRQKPVPLVVQAENDAITIARGTFAGGVSIDVSVDVRGAGASATIIKGGGPVLLIGREQATTEPTVSISGVTIAGGFNTSSPDHAVTQGGGVEIAVGSFPARGGLGATVTITDSVVADNTVASDELLAPGFCGPFDCSFATGGGIANAGTLTLINTRVTDNQAGDPSSMTVV